MQVVGITDKEIDVSNDSGQNLFQTVLLIKLWDCFTYRKINKAVLPCY